MRQLPHLASLVERHKDDRFALIGVNTDEKKDTYFEGAEKHAVTWRSAWEPDYGLPRAWGIRAYPTTYLLDHEGRVRHVDLRHEQLDAAIAELLAELPDQGRRQR